MASDDLLTQRNIDPKEIKTFSPMAKEWWNAKNGPMYTLHDMNKSRIDLICDGLISTNKMKPFQRGEPNAFQGLKMLGECVLVKGKCIQCRNE
jgi:2-polyprenyl-3-methyl-5-hydroxy-6-metoxy-1,4-benzoquinol methylase